MASAAPALEYCETCNKFIRASNWSRHMQTTNHANQKIRCDYCEQTFGRAAELEKHLKRRHGQAVHRCCGAERDEKTHARHRWRQHRSGPQVSSRPRKRPAEDIESTDVKQMKRADDKQNDPVAKLDVSDSDSDSVQEYAANQPVVKSEPEDSLQDFVPEEALAGPSAPAVSLLDDDDYPFYQEPKQVIPSKIWTDMLQYLPEHSAELVMSRWETLRSYINERDPVVRAYNYRMLGSNQMSPEDYFDWMFDQRIDTAFRVKASCHLLLQHKTSKEYKVFYASNNNYNLQVPDREGGNAYFMVNDEASRDRFKQALGQNAMRNLAEASLEDSAWKVSRILGVHFWVLKLPERLMGSLGGIPDHLRRNPNLELYARDQHSNPIRDNLCVFRLVEDCLGNCKGKLENNKVLNRFRDYAAKHGLPTNPKSFPGISIDDLDKVEDLFQLRIQLYHIDDQGRAQLLRRPLQNDNPLFYANLLKTANGQHHLCRILDLDQVVGIYFCAGCDKEFGTHRHLIRHVQKKQCNRGITKMHHPGGLFKGEQSIFKDLEEAGIQFEVPEEERFYEWRACFDFESVLEPIQVHVERPENDDVEMREKIQALNFDIEETDEPLRKLQFMQEHRPIAFCVSSNVPGFTEPYVTSDGNVDELIQDFVKYLEKISAAARELVDKKYAKQIKQLDEMIKEAKQEHEDDEEAWAAEHSTKRRGVPTGIWLYKLMRLKQKFAAWRRSLVVVGFNSGRYDLNLIKDYLYPQLIKRAIEDQQKKHKLKGYDEFVVNKLRLNRNLEEEEDEEEVGENKEPSLSGFPTVIKQGTGIMTLMTSTLRFLDMTRYLSPGTSLDKYLKMWAKQDEIRKQKGLPQCKFGAIKQTKIKFPYSFLDSANKLDHPTVPTKADFQDHLRKEQISDEDYKFIVDLYGKEQFRNFRDYLHYYVRLDVEPFLQAINKSFQQFWDITKIDMFKEALSLPGVTLKYLERETADFRFSLFSPKDDALYQSLRDSITGGLSVVNNRLAVVGETSIRGNDQFKTKNITGYDFNALYLAAIAKQMPMGFYVYWKLCETGTYGPFFYKESKNKPAADEWLEYIAKSRNVTIIHAERNGNEKRIGPRQLPVDGLDEQNKKIYEFKGCFWHMHDPAECSLNKETVNSKTGATVESCQVESTDRKDYMESLGFEYEEIWECRWKQQKEDPVVADVLASLDSKPFHKNKYLSSKKMLQAIEDDSMFGFAKVNLETPDHLKDFFSDFPPVIKNTPVTINDVGPHMRAWLVANEQQNFKTRCLIGSYRGKDVWMLTPMVRYLMQKGVQVTKVSEVLQYDRGCPFGWFKDIVTEKRSEADAAPELQIVGEMFKAIGNNGYGKTVTALHRHVEVTLVGTRELRVVINDPFLENVNVMTEGYYEVTRRPRNKKMNLPMQIGLAVYSYAKLYMMEFAYDVLQKYCDSRLYDLLESDTDSMYLMMACETFDELVLPEKQEEFAAVKSKYFVVDEVKDKRTPGLLKIEFKNGQQMVCLCAKTYAIQSKDDFKLSCKGLMKRCNDFDIETYKKVLATKEAGTGINVGFMQKGGKINTYVQQRSGLSYRYVKRKVLSCGLRTIPLDI